MKKMAVLTLTFSLLIFTGSMFAQYATDFQAVYPFYKGLHQTRNFTFTKDNHLISPAAPGYMIMASSSVDPAIISLSALKLNNDFTISLTRSFVPPSTVKSYSLISKDVIATSDGLYVVCGGVTYDASKWAFIAVFKTDATPVWYKEYPGISMLNAIVEVPMPTEKVKYIACGEKSTSYASNGVILGVDPELIPLWQKNTSLTGGVNRFVYNDVINFKYPGSDIALFAVAGNSVTQPYNDKDVLLTVVDFKGNPYYSYLYGLKNDGTTSYDEEGYGLALSPKGEIVITGRTKCYSASAVRCDDVLTFAVDLYGNTKWMFRYDIPKNASAGEYAQKVLVKDDYLYISGYYSSYVFNPNTSLDAFMIETYLDGKPNYVRVYGSADNDLFYAQEVNYKKNGIISAGFSNSFTVDPEGLKSYSPYVVEAYQNIKDLCKSVIFKLPYYNTELKQFRSSNYNAETSYLKKELIEIKNPANLKIICPKIPLISPLADSSSMKATKEQLANSSGTSINISPNPVLNEIRIAGIEESSSYKIYTVTGKMVKQGIMSSSVINVSGLPKGVYFISVKSSKTNAARKFLKE